MSPAEPQMASSRHTTVADDTEMADMCTAHANGKLTILHAVVTSTNSHRGVHAELPSSDAMQTLGQHSRQLIQAIQNLKKLGIDDTLPSLPSFVVVGDQSAGKSSIIEAICDVSLPRSEGTCTRCPFQITTKATDSTSWSCKVSLHYKYFYDQRSRGRKDAHKYDRWHEQEFGSFNFMTIHNKSELDFALRRAQLALLNPSEDPSLYANPRAKSGDMTSTQVGFSPNYVNLLIEAPGLPEISLYDLPGAINRHEEESEQYLVGFIERLMKNYLKDEQALVLLACASNHDVENSTAFRFVGECQAIDRCMGVLTKPDLLTKNRYAMIRKVLNGEKFRLGNSWFMTKQLSQEELLENPTITHAEARQRERAFFSGDEPWTVQFADFSDRFGIPSLQDAISQKLTAHIAAALPEIIARVQGRLGEVNELLASFPPKPVSAAHTVMDEMQLVLNNIIAHVRGDNMEGCFRNEYRLLLDKTREDLKDRRPHVELRTPGYQLPSIELDISSDEEEAAPTPVETPSKMRRGNNGQPIRTPQKQQQAAREATGTPRTRVKGEKSEKSVQIPPRVIFKLDETRERLDRGSSSGLPNQINPKVTDGLILQSLAGWRTVVGDLMTGIRKLLAETMERTIQETLETRPQTQLFVDVKTTVEDFCTTVLSAQTKAIMHIVACELHKPVTCIVNLRELTTHAETKLRHDRLVQRVNEYLDPLEAKGVKVPSKADRLKKLTEYEPKIKQDDYSREVSALGTPLAYYDIAAARMLDNIASHLELGLLHPLEIELRPTLKAALRVTDEAHCVHLLAEDPGGEAERGRLVLEREKLEMALRELQGLPR